MDWTVTRRRDTDPQTVQRLWEAVNYIRAQRQVANADRICRYMHREFGLNEDGGNLLLDHATAEKLIVRYDSRSMKVAGAPEQYGYSAPQADDESFQKDANDWYCFECHRPGEVVDCSACWRAYHTGCLDDAVATRSADSNFVCTFCQVKERKPAMKKRFLNHLLSFTVVRLKEKEGIPGVKTQLRQASSGRKRLNLCESMNITRLDDKKASDALHRLFSDSPGDALRRQRFVHSLVDLVMMEAKAARRHYRTLEQFEADARTVQHCALIAHGQTGFIADLARQMMLDCQYDLKEIRRCKDCYYNSNEKPEDWFAQPCTPPHELVFAKQRGFCYWPAKVLQIASDGSYDIRFFGGHHNRALIPPSSIKPVDSSRRSLDLKSSSSLKEALAEVSRHERLLNSAAPMGASHAAQLSTDDEEEEEEVNGESRALKTADEAGSPVATPAAKKASSEKSESTKKAKIGSGSKFGSGKRKLGSSAGKGKSDMAKNGDDSTKPGSAKGGSSQFGSGKKDSAKKSSGKVDSEKSTSDKSDLAKISSKKKPASSAFGSAKSAPVKADLKRKSLPSEDRKKMHVSGSSLVKRKSYNSSISFDDPTPKRVSNAQNSDHDSDSDADKRVDEVFAKKQTRRIFVKTPTSGKASASRKKSGIKRKSMGSGGSENIKGRPRKGVRLPFTDGGDEGNSSDPEDLLGGVTSVEKPNDEIVSPPSGKKKKLGRPSTSQPKFGKIAIKKHEPGVGSVEPACVVTSSEDRLLGGLVPAPGKPISSEPAVGRVETKVKAVQTRWSPGDDSSKTIISVGVQTETPSAASGQSGASDPAATSELANGKAGLGAGSCRCKEEYEARRAELVERLGEEHRMRTEAALAELKAGLCAQFAEARAAADTSAGVRREAEATENRREVEAQCRVEYLELVKGLEAEHARLLAAAKKKQWCYHCGEEAMYHCCWNTSYCSTTCQQEHWQSEHKKVCRRKRKN